jgi:hypothetical protein
VGEGAKRTLGVPDEDEFKSSDIKGLVIMKNVAHERLPRAPVTNGSLRRRFSDFG